jgi:hypothetical protein
MPHPPQEANFNQGRPVAAHLGKHFVALPSYIALLNATTVARNSTLPYPYPSFSLSFNYFIQQCKAPN